ncbi:MAG: hypothetical protein KBD01_03975 [Acidobacteria bacterium]|nr:hypothetical protein [Acidobacteriota bacterium]
MRPAAVVKWMGIAIGLVLVSMLAPPLAMAQQDCIDACIEQWDIDKAACDQALADRMAQLDAEAQACYDLVDPILVGKCIRTVNIKRYVAKREWQDCMNMANTVAYNCYRNCQQSESNP